MTQLSAPAEEPLSCMMPTPLFTGGTWVTAPLGGLTVVGLSPLRMVPVPVMLPRTIQVALPYTSTIRDLPAAVKLRLFAALAPKLTVVTLAFVTVAGVVLLPMSWTLLNCCWRYGTTSTMPF